MRKPCAKGVENQSKTCGFEHFLCTKTCPVLGGLWVVTRLFLSTKPMFSIPKTTTFLSFLPLFSIRFSPLSPGLITKPII